MSSNRLLIVRTICYDFGMLNPRDLKIVSRTSANGYVYLGVPGHPYATKKGHYVYEHRFKMEKRLGRFLLPGEVVHHRNSKKRQNHVRNLELTTHGKHSALHSRLRAKPSKKLSCAECGAIFYRKEYNQRSKNHFCSSSCNMKYYVRLGIVRRKAIAKHGSITMYGYHGCRCTACREASRTAKARQRKNEPP